MMGVTVFRAARSADRIERRRVWVSNDVMKYLGEELLGRWPGLASVAVVESSRQDLSDLSGKTSVERRYFISSHDHANAELFARAIRGHWGVENQLHGSTELAEVWRLES